MDRCRRWTRIAGFVCSAAIAASCTPALNWRTVAVGGSDASAMFPCRPDDVERPIRLADRTLSMHLIACRAEQSTYAVALVNVSDGFAAETALSELRTRSTANIDGHEQSPERWVPKGSQTHGERVTVVGRWPGGAALVEERASVLARGKMYRLSVIGDAPPREAVDYFFASFTVSPP